MPLAKRVRVQRMQSWFLLAVFLLATAQIWAQSSSTTTLAASATSLAWPTPVTLTAAVSAAGKAVSPGLIKFCNASAASCQGTALLGQAQLGSSGTASIKLVPAIGSHSIKAVFAGTKPDATSSSTAETVTVTGVLPTTTAISASATSPYTLTASVAVNARALSGSVSFNEVSSGNSSLTTAALGAASTTLGFFQGMLSGTGSEPTALAIGDFNGDGISDIAVGNINANSSGVYTLTIFLSDGLGTYARPVSVSLPGSFQNPSALAVGDFNNDGNLDLAVASDNSNQVLILLGNGGGAFVEAGAVSAGSGPNSIAVGDFDRDGNADLAVTNQSSSTVSILLGNGEGGFVAVSQSPATGSEPYSVAAGDFNGDGKQDLAIANYYGSNVTVLLGNGDGTFTASASSPATEVYPDWVAVGDFNADGKQDLAVTNQFSKTVTILIGDGKGDFTATSTSPATGANPGSVAVGDFNGDGIQDLAVANTGDSTMSILLGKGDGTFPIAQVLQLPGGTAPDSVAVAELNGDGNEDFAVAGSGNSSIVVGYSIPTTSAKAIVSGVTVPGGGKQTVDASFPGNANYGASTSAPIVLAGTVIPTTLGLTIEPSGTVGVGETVQLTAAISPAVGTLMPSGSVSFYNGATLIATVPVANGLAIYNDSLTAAGTESLSAKYTGDGNFTSSASGTDSLTVIAPTTSTTTLTVSSNSVTKGTILTLTATVTNGGKAVTQGTVLFGYCYPAAEPCEMPYRLILGTAQLTSKGTATIKLALPVGARLIYALFAGTNDVVSSASSLQTVTVTGTLPSTTALAVTGAAGNYTLTANVKGSWPPPSGNVSFLDTSNQNLVLGTSPLNPAIPVLTRSSAMAAGNGPASIAVGDFNGDGKPDMAVVGFFSNTMSVFLNNGDGTFTPKTSAIPSTVTLNEPLNVVAADFNRDGILDLAVANFNSDSVTILLGKGNGTFTQQASPATGSGPEAIAVADFNGDGKLDLAVTNSNSGNVTILLGSGDGTFSPEPEIPSTGSSPRGIVAADFDGDGKVDLAVANFLSATVTILLGNGDGTFIPAAVSPATVTEPGCLVAADFNGDGRPDLAVANSSSSGSVTILLNQGGGNFTNVSPAPVAGAAPVGIVAADFNGDGIVDSGDRRRARGKLNATNR